MREITINKLKMAAPKSNKYALGNTGGRPPTYASVKDLNKKVIDFFEQCIQNKEKATITGLALFLGFCTRKSLDDYEAKGEEFLYTIKRAKLTVEHSYEMSGQTIDIFCLKNMGWSDKQDIDLTTNLSSLSEEALNYIANKLIKEQHEKQTR